MSIDAYFENTARILEKITDSKNINISVVNHIVHDFQQMGHLDLIKLSKYKDYSFSKDPSYQVENSLQLFQKFIQQISTLPILSQSYLLAIATLNIHGDIREKAIWRLAESNLQVALPFTLIRLHDKVQKVSRAARQCSQNNIWDNDLDFLTHFFAQSSTKQFLRKGLFWGTELYFYECRYLPMQGLPTILEKLREIEQEFNNDSGVSQSIRNGIAKKFSSSPLFFDLVKQSKSAKFRNELIANIPVSMINPAINHHAALLKKLPNLYAQLMPF